MYTWHQSYSRIIIWNLSFLPLIALRKIVFFVIPSKVATTPVIIMLNNRRPPIIILTEPARLTDSAAVSIFCSEVLVFEEERSIAPICEEVVLGDKGSFLVDTFVAVSVMDGDVVLDDRELTLLLSVADGPIDAGLENVVECFVGVVVLLGDKVVPVTVYVIVSLLLVRGSVADQVVMGSELCIALLVSVLMNKRGIT